MTFAWETKKPDLPTWEVAYRSISLAPDEFDVLVNLVDNAWRMADEYREGREPNTDSETKALVYQLTIERIQTALKGA